MAAIVLTGTDTVKSVIVISDKTVSPFWVFPYPILKCLLDSFLLCLCCRRFLCIEHRFFVALFIIHIVKDTNITQVQSILNNAVGRSPLCTVGAVCLDIIEVGAFVLNKPIAVKLGVAHLDFSSGVLRRSKQLHNKLLNILLRYPSRSQTDGDFGSGQVFRNDLF